MLPPFALTLAQVGEPAAMRFDVPDPTVYAIPFFLVSLLIEPWLLRRQRARGRTLVGHERRDTAASLAMGIVSLLPVFAINLGTYALASLLWRWRLTDLGAGPLAWAIAMVGWDFSYYWFHRMEHERRVLWACHVNHHSSQHYNLSTALRQPWTPWFGWVVYPPWALLGVRPELILMSGGFNLIYQYWIHTEAVDRLPAWVEALFNTPSHHRVHHGSNLAYLDKNYAGILIVWDRLFGTFTPEVEPPVYGLTKNIQTFHPWHIAWHEYVALARDLRRARDLRTRFLLCWRGPGEQPELPPTSPSRQTLPLPAES